MPEAAFEPKPWRVKQILDPEVEKEASDSVIQMLVDYDPASVAHIMFSNHTWEQESLLEYIEFYKERLPEKVVEDINIVARNCDSVHFQTFLEKHGINHLPIYTGAIDMSTIDAKCHSRTFPDPAEFLANGSANVEELFAFVLGVLSDVLKAMFSSKEIKKMLVDLRIIETLLNCHSRDDEIGNDTDKKFDYEYIKTMRSLQIDIPHYFTRMPHSITHFLVFFALHTIRENCYASFGIDREIKVYQKEMYHYAVDHLKDAKSKMSNRTTNVKKEKMNLGVKREKKDSSSDDDSIEIIEDTTPTPPRKSNLVTNGESSSSGSANNSNVTESVSNQMDNDKDYPEKEMMMALEREDLPMVFKTKFRKLVEHNRNMRDEIEDYKKLIKIFIKEKDHNLN